MARVIIVVIAEILLILVADHYVNSNFMDRHIKLTMEERTQLAKSLGDQFRAYFIEARRDLLQLTNSASLKGYIKYKHNEGTKIETQLKGIVQKAILALSTARMRYRQIRYIDEEGQEIIRVDFRNGKATLMPAMSRQNKADRYYFKRAMTFRPGKVYISQLDLNIEDGRIEKPEWATIRLATPIYTRDEEKAGIVIFNMDASAPLSILRSAAPSSMMMIDPDGYYVMNKDQAKEWGQDHSKEKMRDKSKLTPAQARELLATAPQFRKDFDHNLFARLNGKNASFFQDGIGYASYHVKLNDDAWWTIIDRLTPSDEFRYLYDARNAVIVLFALLFFLQIAVIWFTRQAVMTAALAAREDGGKEKRS